MRGRSYHAKHLIGDKDLFDNSVIVGDNLLALKVLEQECVGKDKCVSIESRYLKVL